MSNTSFAEMPAHPATPRQRQFIQALAATMNLSTSDLETEIRSDFGCSFSALSRRDASVLIERLQHRRAQPGRSDLYREPPTNGES